MGVAPSLAHDGFHRCPAHQPARRLGDVAPVHGGVGLPVAWGQPGPAGELAKTGEARDVADLGHEHRSTGPTPGIAWMAR